MTMTDAWNPIVPGAYAPPCRCPYCLQNAQARPPCGCPDCLRKAWSCDSLGLVAPGQSASSGTIHPSISAVTSLAPHSGSTSSRLSAASPQIAAAAAAAAAAVDGLLMPGWGSASAQYVPQLPPSTQLPPSQHLLPVQQQQQPNQPQSQHHHQPQQQPQLLQSQQQQRSPHFLTSSEAAAAAAAAAAATDPASSDEALSPLHQEDLDDAMDMKEASKLQQEIVKAWKQKKRPSCEMKTRTQDKYRQVYSSHQRFELEKEYHFQKYISTARKSELSRTLRLSERQIKIWFQNRRAKERRQKKNQQHKGLPDSPAPSSPGDALDDDEYVKQEEDGC